MTLDAVMAELESLEDERMLKHHLKAGAGKNLFGAKTGDIRKVAKKIKTDPELAKQLWKTGNLEAMMLTTLIVKPKELSAKELDGMVRDVDYGWLADWLNNYVVKKHPEKEELRLKWMADEHPSAARSGWSLTTSRVVNEPDGLDIGALLDRIENEMGDAPELAKWTMNFCLAEIGINFPEHRKRAIAIGEKIGAYRDYPVSKGCTSPFAPIWINKLVARNS